MASNLTLTSTAFGTGKFGQALTGGYASGAQSGPATFTIELWFKTTSTSSTLAVMAGWDNAGWIGVQNGKLICGGWGSPDSTLSVADGNWHHAAVTYDPSSKYVTALCDGVKVNSVYVGTAIPAGSQFHIANLTYGSSANAYQFTGSVDEVAIWSGLKYTGSYTVPTAAYAGTETNLAALYHLDGDANDSLAAASSALAIGSLSAAGGVGGVALSLSAALSGGSGAGYSYKIYRGTDPNFTVNSGSLLTTQTAMPYTDTTAAEGTSYYYGVIGSDGAAATVNAVPAGLSPLASSPSTLLFASASRPISPPLAIVFIGDSITYGAGLANAGSATAETPPAIAAERLRRRGYKRGVFIANTGLSGSATADWQPSKTPYSNAKTAMTNLLSANPTAKPVFSIMLGTNDSSATLGAVAPAIYKSQLKAIVDQLLVDFPAAQIVLHEPTWYSPNTHNSATYEQAGLSLLTQYAPQIEALVASYATQVALGDTVAYKVFAETYLTNLQGEAGTNGTFYLHPITPGALVLGELWASGIGKALDPHRFTIKAA